MKPCEENLRLIPQHVDGELSEGEVAAFQSHLAVCEGCRATLEEERRFLGDLRWARPIHKAPPDLRSRVDQILRDATVEPAPQPTRVGTQGVLERISAWLSGSWWPILQAVSPIVLVAAILVGLFVMPPAHSEFALDAVKVHKLHSKGKLPLQLRSASPVTISGWVNAKAPFKLSLPSYDEAPLPPAQPYRYEGATLVSYHNAPAAYVSYRTGGSLVSLVALPTSIAQPLRGKEVVMKSLKVYYDTVDGLHVITWSGPKSRLTYALVTDLEHPSQSCIICHASKSAKDRDLMARLQSK